MNVRFGLCAVFVSAAGIVVRMDDRAAADRINLKENPFLDEVERVASGPL